jgi:hypothetical protein
VCVRWGQHVTQNAAVRDEFLSQATQTMTYLREHLSAQRFAGIVGMDPYNEPHAGRYDSGQNSRTWEQGALWPFFQRFHAAMDTGAIGTEFGHPMSGYTSDKTPTVELADGAE